VYGAVNGFPFSAQLPNAICSWYLLETYNDGSFIEEWEGTWFYWMSAEDIDLYRSSLNGWGETEISLTCQTTLAPWNWAWDY